MLNKLTEHLDEVGETYWQHFKVAACMSLRLSVASYTQLLHAVFPFIKPPLGTDVCSLIEYFKKKTPEVRRQENCDD
jgi:hypothetical protein